MFYDHKPRVITQKVWFITSPFKFFNIDPDRILEKIPFRLKTILSAHLYWHPAATIRGV